jgi:hypothetical protein
LVTVTEVGGDEPEGVVDRLGVGVNENAAWVNSPGEPNQRGYVDSSRLIGSADDRRLAYTPSLDLDGKAYHRCAAQHDATLQLDYR